MRRVGEFGFNRRIGTIQMHNHQAPSTSSRTQHAHDSPLVTGEPYQCLLFGDLDHCLGTNDPALGVDRDQLETIDKKWVKGLHSNEKEVELHLQCDSSLQARSGGLSLSEISVIKTQRYPPSRVRLANGVTSKCSPGARIRCKDIFPSSDMNNATAPPAMSHIEPRPSNHPGRHTNGSDRRRSRRHRVRSFSWCIACRLSSSVDSECSGGITRASTGFLILQFCSWSNHT